MASLVSRGWKQVSSPQVGAVISFSGGIYGHVAFIEAVNQDGTFLISECNYNNVQNQVHYQVMKPASNQSYAVMQ